MAGNSWRSVASESVPDVSASRSSGRNGAAAGILMDTNGGDGVRSDGLAAADRVDPFVGLGFQADVVATQAEYPGKRRADRREMRIKLWPLADHDHVHVN